jgi:tRNA(His) 5'-end guanylyltransferase
MKKDDLGDRMKQYEGNSKVFLTKKVPVIIRCDGKGFSKLTKGLERPYSKSFILTMLASAQQAAKQMQGFQVGYVQSDEVTFFLRDYDTVETQPWFANNKTKIESIAASLMTGYFNSNFKYKDKIGFFDARAFSVPREDVANCFLWRAKDCRKNAISMYASSVFPQKTLEKKSTKERLEMIKESGVDWEAIDNSFKNGTFFFKDGSTDNTILANYSEVAEILDPIIYPDKFTKVKFPLIDETIDLDKIFADTN